ncbi:Yip1-like protein [Cellulophaga sp. RHA_52]|uniref:YIP1 family protein n=1 Tax=Cellulophaga sp. RHA_52 TaxID=1250036 RepID=UPI00119C42B2|nr:YIP1 family protein [Cellulophaga sp. RHA_52]TVZ07911.1 Yip1-like protein [Cellulophaga sp. RHA_52]
MNHLKTIWRNPDKTFESVLNGENDLKWTIGFFVINGIVPCALILRSFDLFKLENNTEFYQTLGLVFVVGSILGIGIGLILAAILKVADSEIEWTEIFKVLTWASAPLLIAGIFMTITMGLGRLAFHLGDLSAPSILFQLITGILLFGIFPLYIWSTILINKGLKKIGNQNRSWTVTSLLTSMIPLLLISYLLISILLKN